jgi:mRNA-degrading endonuclease RelE of RelBE toxin-antitoxin system
LTRKLVIAEPGRRSLKKMPREAQRQILKKITEFDGKPDLIAAHLKHMTDSKPPMSRLRMGDFRAFGHVEGETLYMDIFLDKKDV